MFIPVSPDEVFSTPAGKDFYAKFIDSPDDPLFIRSERIKNSATGGRNLLSERESARRLRVCAHWLTANYDPATNTHTLYRGVDAKRFEDFKRTGKVTSRAVDFFGDGSTEQAIRTMKRAEKGKFDREMRAKGDMVIAAAEDAYRGNALPVNDYRRTKIKDIKDLFAGKPSDAAISSIAESRTLLQAAQKGGSEAYKQIIERAGSDDTPSRIPVSVHNLSYPSIHLTTDPEFIREMAMSGRADKAVKLTFEPGSLPVAPNVGVIDNQLIVAGHPNFNEREWYGVGQLDGHQPGVMIEEIPSFRTE